jgi:hypothetical protein
MNNSQSDINDENRDRFARLIAARLCAASDDVPHDISERLRAGRMRALEQHRSTRLRLASTVNSNGSSAALSLGGDDFTLWKKFASFVPLVALVAGLIAIAVAQEESRTNEIAEVDTELLTDDLPPAAFTDPGFAQFLKLNQGQ